MSQSKLAKFMHRHSHTHTWHSIRSTKKVAVDSILFFFRSFVFILLLSLPLLSTGLLSRFCSSSINGLTSPSLSLFANIIFFFFWFLNFLPLALFALLKLINFIINFDMSFDHMNVRWMCLRVGLVYSYRVYFSFPLHLLVDWTKIMSHHIY